MFHLKRNQSTYNGSSQEYSWDRDKIKTLVSYNKSWLSCIKAGTSINNEHERDTTLLFKVAEENIGKAEKSPWSFSGSQCLMETHQRPPLPLPEEAQQQCQTPGQGMALTMANAQEPVLREAGTTRLSNQGLLGAVLLKKMVCFLMQIHFFQLFCKRTDVQKGFLVCRCTWWSIGTF